MSNLNFKNRLLTEHRMSEADIKCQKISVGSRARKVNPGETPDIEWEETTVKDSGKVESTLEAKVSLWDKISAGGSAKATSPSETITSNEKYQAKCE